MNYEIIKDEQKLKEFVDNFLPDLTDDETFYVCLFARSKYVTNKEISHINSDKAQLKRFTTSKERLIDKLRQLECPLGSYKQKENTAPQESLAVYINPNPRSNSKALTNGIIRCATLIANKAQGFSFHQEMISEVQKAKSRTAYVDFDFDTNDPDALIDIEAVIAQEHFINEEAVHFLRTRGGFHLLVETSKVKRHFEKTWYNNILNLQATISSDIRNDQKEGEDDNMIPIPGCTQGGFIPHFIK